MIEYEYSFKVKSLIPYINYCKENNFEKIEESSQTRVLYTNENKILARITTSTINGKKSTVLNFKDDNNSKEVLKISRESIPLEIKNNDMAAVISILEILGYSKYKTLIRKRIIYKKNDVTFELDNYTKPESMQVIAIEGDKSKEDKIYNELKNKFNLI